MIAPCKDCTRRSLGCHGQCNDYKEWKDYNEAVHERKRKIAAATPDMSRESKLYQWKQMKNKNKKIYARFN